ncbi:hypothetical protein UlMin_022333 [Ulmus minor]
MTIDDESSVYVGGISDDTTEISLRRVFSSYGSIVAVKINDRGMRANCYGFVTFTNPRSAIDAINAMDGRTIDGKVVRVNGVRSRPIRGGRSSFGRDSFRWNIENGRGRDRGRYQEQDQERDYDYDRERDRSGDRSREREFSQDYDLERETGYEHLSDHGRAVNSYLDRDRDRKRDLEDREREHSRNHYQGRERDYDTDTNRDKEIDRTNGDHECVERDMDQGSRKGNGSTFDRHCRETLSNLNEDHGNQVKEQLGRSTQMLEELKKEIFNMEEKIKDKGKHVLGLQQKCKKLEDALIKAKKNSSHHKMQLTKLSKCFMQVRDYSEKLQSSEKEFQSLVDMTMSEILGDDVALRD